MGMARDTAQVGIRDEGQVTAVSQGMNWLHTCMSPPLLHLDLKTSNLLVDEFFGVKVADFGLSQLKLGEIKEKVGSPFYMSPEMLVGNIGDVGTPSDVYSFAVVLWELATGLEPYEGEKFRSIQGKPGAGRG